MQAATQVLLFLHEHALLGLSITLLLPLICHLLWRLTPSTKPSPSAHHAPSAPTKKNRFYGTTTAPLTFASVQPFPHPSPATSLAPDQWWRDPYISDRVYTPTMALRACAFDDWLRVDRNYADRMAHKRNVLDTYGWPVAIDCRREAEAAVEELLECLVGYLPRRFPSVWVVEEGRWLRSLVTGERFEVRAPWGGLRGPLEVVARVTEEDLAVLVPGEVGGEEEYVLKAVVSAFPAGFDIQEKIDRGLTAIHEPVPVYKEKLRKAMNKSVECWRLEMCLLTCGRFFKNMSADRLVMRVNWGINDKEELFFLDGTHLYEGDTAAADENIDINQVQLRVERQVVRRLPKSGAMCMLTKTCVVMLLSTSSVSSTAF